METQRDNEPHHRDSNLSSQVTPAKGLRIIHDNLAAPVRLCDDGIIAVEVDRAVFDLDAVLRAAYKFTDRCHVFIQSSGEDSTWLAVLRPKVATPLMDLAGEFSNELIDQRLRRSLEEQFGNLRTLIVAQAFSEGNLLDADRSLGDYNTDPLKIATPR